MPNVNGRAYVAMFISEFILHQWKKYYIAEEKWRASWLNLASKNSFYLIRRSLIALTDPPLLSYTISLNVPWVIFALRRRCKFWLESSVYIITEFIVLRSWPIRVFQSPPIMTMSLVGTDVVRHWGSAYNLSLSLISAHRAYTLHW